MHQFHINHNLYWLMWSSVEKTAMMYTFKFYSLSVPETVQTSFLSILSHNNHPYFSGIQTASCARSVGSHLEGDSFMNTRASLTVRLTTTASGAASVLAATSPSRWILASDRSILITWSQYWPLIGQYWSRDLNTDAWLVNITGSVHHRHVQEVSPGVLRVQVGTSWAHDFWLSWFLTFCFQFLSEAAEQGNI